MDSKILTECYIRFNNFSVLGRNELYNLIMRGKLRFYSEDDPHIEEQILVLSCFDYFDEMLQCEIWNY